MVNASRVPSGDVDGEYRQYVEGILQPIEISSRPQREFRFSWEVARFYVWVALMLALVVGFGAHFVGRFFQAIAPPQSGVLGRFVTMLVWSALTLGVLFVVGIAALGEDDPTFFFAAAGVYGLACLILQQGTQRLRSDPT